jgi:hypothetical protein
VAEETEVVTADSPDAVAGETSTDTPAETAEEVEDEESEDDEEGE